MCSQISTPGVLVAMLYWLPEKSGPPTMAFTAPVEGSIDTSFQSVFGPEEWLRPYTVEHVAELARAGKKRIAVISPAFSADCIETLEEINGEIREAFLHAGGESFAYVPCLNDDDAHIAALMAVLGDNLAGWA